MPRAIDKQHYRQELKSLQIELVKLQKHFIGCGDKILVILEGRDAAGKDGAIKRVVKHLSPRETRVVALGKPSDHDRGAWYFQRYVPHLPASGEFVLFNRSWYNRAGVEQVMGFCSKWEYEEFMETVVGFERMLIGSGVRLFKYYLDISRKEQRQRLRKRARNPLTQWKTSPIDAKAQKYWKRYNRFRDAMLKRTHSPDSPWYVIRADDKRAARLNLIRHLLAHLDYCDKDKRLARPDPGTVFAFGNRQPKKNMLAK